MGRNWLNETDDGLRTFALSFGTQAVADPIPIGLTAPIAAAYLAQAEAFDAAVTAARGPDRGPAKTQAKNSLKIELIAETRRLARVVQACLTTTDEDRVKLNLPVHDTEPSPIPRPTLAPLVSVVSVTGHTVRLRLANAELPSSRARPPGTAGAMIFRYIGEAAPTGVDGWTFAGNTAQTQFDVTFDAAVPAGSKVWLTASWFNPRLETGPGAEPVSTTIGGGFVMAA